MREIKFKAWNIERKEMYEVGSMTFRNNWIGLNALQDNKIGDTIGINYKDRKYKDDYVMAQYIFKDANSIEIYEDVTVFKFHLMIDLRKSVELIGTFHYNEDELRYEIDVHNNNNYASLWYKGNGEMHSFEVIGNIYENKELINK